MAAQDAELQLKVSLDLAFFKQQLAGLGQASAGYNVPINVKFDRKRIADEYRLLNRYISGKEFKVLISSNLKTEIDNADKLTKAIGRVQQAAQGAKGGLPIGTGALGLKKGPGQPAVNEIKALYEALAMAGVEGFEQGAKKNRAQMVTAIGAVGRDTIAGLLNGLNSQNIQLQKAAESLGEILIATIKNTLGIASPSREFRKIGQNVGEGFQQGMMSSMDKAFDAVEGLMRARMKVLDIMARGMFRMVGVDPAAIRAEAAQRRALPGVNFPATIPPRNFSIGPSGTGRALPPGSTPSALPGTAFGAQKYLPTALGEELKQILRGAAFAFVDSLMQQVRSARIGIAASQQPLLGASRIAGLLPAGVGRTPSAYSTGAIGGESREQMIARRTREAYMRSSLREMDVLGGGAGRPPSPYSHAYRGARPLSAMVPYSAGGAIVPVGGGGGGGVPPSGRSGSMFGGMGGFGQALGNIQLPGTGVVREIGSEFAMATKQVLLFGTAYKALAFATSFPAQVGQAVGALQSFNNTLKAVSPSAAEAAASNELILSLVDRYNIPLQSARDGFTKLYASMQPAGFSGEEIRTIFTGISKAAAAFGMSADKVDRVNYAFAQMASKGQVMSEELKGQLGDVLPGAMAIFAEAAGFKGPKAIQDFSKALEDGAYKGQAMKVLLQNVGTIMNKEFGPGAEGAARTFQGAINRMQNSLTLFYQSFEPVAVGFLNAVVTPMTQGIKTLTDGLNAFFTGTAAKTAGGFGIAMELEKLRPAFDGIRANVAGLIPVFAQLAQVALGLGRVLLAIAGNPLVGYLAKLYAIFLPLNMALNVMRGLWAANALQLVIFNARVASGTSTLTAFRGMMAATGATAQATATSIRTAGLTLRTFFATTGVGLVVVGISLLIERFMSMNQALADTKAKALGAAQAIRSMSQTEARTEGQRIARNIKDLQGLQRSKESLRLGGEEMVPVQGDMAKRLQEGGVGIRRDLLGRTLVPKTSIAAEILRQQGLQAETDFRQRQIQSEKKLASMPAAIAPIPPSEGESGKTKGRRVSFEDIADQESQRAARLEASKKELRLSQLIAAARIAGNESEAESLETLKPALEIRGKIAKLTEFRNMLIRQEGELIAKKSLTPEKFNNKLQDSNVELGILQNELQQAYLDMQAKEADNNKKAQDDRNKKIKDQLDINRALEDAAILAGAVSPQQAAIRKQRREFDDQMLQLRERGATPEQLSSLAAYQAATPQAGSFQESLRTLREEMDKLVSTQEMVKTSASSIGEAFSSAFRDTITGASSAQEALSGFFTNVANSFADMVSEMISKWLQAQLIQGFMSLFPGMGSFTGGASIGQSVSLPSATGIGAGGGILQNAGGQGFGTFGPNFGIRQFANGGVVSGPTLGLIGEGRFNEAVIPMPDGKSVPVDLGGAAGNNISTNIVVNVNNGQVQGGSTSEGSADLGRKMEGAVKQVLVNELRPGGLLSGGRR